MIKPETFFQEITQFESGEEETSLKNVVNSFEFNQLEDKDSKKDTFDQIQKPQIQQNILSLISNEQVKSENSSQSNYSDDMDIDQQNDIVNDLSFIENSQKADQEDDIFTNLSAKDRVLYANTKKHEGNQHFRQNNLEQAIEAYKVGLSLLKPQSFALASPNDCMLMAELTSNILYNMGTCYFILMSYRYAIKFYDQAILIKPNYAKAIHNRALCHLEQGNLLQAFNDVKLALNYDKHNLSVQSDLKKIEREYYGVYQQHKLEKQKICLDPSQTRVMSKSMIENSSTNFKLEESDETASSLIKKQEKPRNNIQITKLSQKNFLFEQTKPEKYPNITPKQRVKSFYSKKFYRNQIPKTPKTVKRTPTSLDSPKFRPYVLNKRLNIGNGSPLFWDTKKTETQKCQQSAGDFLERQKQIVLIQDKIKQLNQKNWNPKEKDKKRQQKQRQKKTQNNQENYWGYIPLFVATGYGLYHSFRAVLGK